MDSRVLGIYKIPRFEDSVSVECHRASQDEVRTTEHHWGSPLRSNNMALKCIESPELGDLLLLINERVKDVSWRGGDYQRNVQYDFEDTRLAQSWALEW